MTRWESQREIILHLKPPAEGLTARACVIVQMTMVLVRSLQENGLVQCKGAVATLAPSRARARLVRGTLDALGLGQVPVATGTDGGFTKYTASFEETSRDYIAPDNDTFDEIRGIDLLKQLYESASESSLELLCM